MMDRRIRPDLLDRACEKLGHQIYGGGPCRRCGLRSGEVRSAVQQINDLMLHYQVRPDTDEGAALKRFYDGFFARNPILDYIRARR